MEVNYQKISEQDLLISRQVIEGIFSFEDQRELQQKKVCVMGLRGLGFEVVKNLCFLGVKSIYLCDDRRSEIQDSTFNIFHSKEDYEQKKTRSHSTKDSFEKFKKNTDYNIINKNEIINDQFLLNNKISFVIITDFVLDSLTQLFDLNNICKKFQIGFIFAYSSIIQSFQYSCFRENHKLLKDIYDQKFAFSPELFLTTNNKTRQKDLLSVRIYSIFKFFEQKSKIPQYMNNEDLKNFNDILMEEGSYLNYKDEEILENNKLGIYLSLQFIVVSSFWAPFLVNSIIQKVKFPKENQSVQIIGWQDYQLVKQNYLEQEQINPECPYLYEKIIFGIKQFEKIQKGNYLLAGCGAVGCEQAKCLTLLGLGQMDGFLTIVDNDTIEVSNMNRQIFYGKEDNKKFKSQILSKKIKDINPDINCISKVGQLSKENEMEFFNYDRFAELDAIICCFDNVIGRQYLSQIAKRSFVCLIDSATHGFLAQSQIQIPYYTSSICIAEENSKNNILKLLFIIFS